MKIQVYKELSNLIQIKRKKLKNLKNPYGDGNSAKHIVNILEKINLNLSTQKINTY